MKLKLMQLVGMLSMLCAMSTMLAAAAIEGQLTQVQVSSRGNVATVTLRTPATSERSVSMLFLHFAHVMSGATSVTVPMDYLTTLAGGR